MMERGVLATLSGAAACLMLPRLGVAAMAQTGACAKPRVAVELTSVHEQTVEVLQRQDPVQTKEMWRDRIQGKMLEKLKANSPGVPIGAAGSGGAYDYSLRYNVAVIGCGQQEQIGDLRASKDTCYWVLGALFAHDACGTAGMGVQSANSQHRDLEAAVTRFAGQMGNLDTVTAQHERERPIPPRGPQIRLRKQPKPVSALDGERETEIEAILTNCRGEPVDDPVGKRYGVIAGPKDSARGHTHPPTSQRAFASHGNGWLISPNAGGLATLKYNLENGVTPGRDPLTFMACGLGAQAEIKHAVAIDGLEIRVQPETPRLHPGDSTKVVIEFAKVSAEGGKKHPLADRELTLRIEGLQDGVCTPRATVRTDSAGGGIVTCRAGQNDKNIRITAAYQPQNFPDKAEGSAVIAVQEEAGDLFVEITGGIHYVKENEAHRVQVSTDFRYVGTMKQMRRTRHRERYESNRMEVSWTHTARVIQRNPQSGCEGLIEEVTSAGSQPVPVSYVELVYEADKPSSKNDRKTRLVLEFSPGKTPGKVKVRNPYPQCATYAERFENLGIARITYSEEISSPQATEITGSRFWGVDQLYHVYLINQDVIFGSSTQTRFPPGAELQLKWVIKRTGDLR